MVIKALVYNAKLSVYLSVNKDSLITFWVYKNKLIENQWPYRTAQVHIEAELMIYNTIIFGQ